MRKLREESQMQIVETIDIFREMHNEQTGGWVVREDGKMCWLQRIAMWVLRRYGERGYIQKETITYSRFNKDDLFECLLKTSQSTILNYVDRGFTPKIYIGSEDFQEMMKLPDIRRYLSFTSRPPLNNRNGPILIDMPVEVLPWMRGVLVVPT